MGGGSTALEEGLYLAKFASKVYFVHRRGMFRGEKILAKRVTKNPKIEIVWNSIVEEICGAEEVEKIKIKNLKTEKTSDLALQSLRINAQLKRKQSKKPDPYFCFVNPGKDDVVEDGQKIVGSAQRRRNRTFFQHGSIKISPEIKEGNKNRGKIIDSLVLGFEKKFGIRLLPGQLTREEVKLSRQLREVKYSTRNWNYRR
ncbi:Octanoyltransferase LipM [subsurface metagenome]